MSFNPYAAPPSFPSGPNPSDPGQAAAKVLGPAVGLMVVAGLGMAVHVLSLCASVLGITMFAAAANNQPRGASSAVMMAQGGVGIVINILVIILGVVIVLGAIKMMKLESYGLAMTSAILAMIPCFYPCCVLGLPFGIWALVVLNDPSVKSAFR